MIFMIFFLRYVGDVCVYILYRIWNHLGQHSSHMRWGPQKRL